MAPLSIVSHEDVDNLLQLFMRGTHVRPATPSSRPLRTPPVLGISEQSAVSGGLMLDSGGKAGGSPCYRQVAGISFGKRSYSPSGSTHLLRASPCARCESRAIRFESQELAK
jgi:hypothetical protein